MLDGHGLYGAHEHTDLRPCDLDSCLGHFGPVPANEELGIPAHDAFHYHISDLEHYPSTATPALAAA